jgi:hypothetical protein
MSSVSPADAQATQPPVGVPPTNGALPPAPPEDSDDVIPVFDDEPPERVVMPSRLTSVQAAILGALLAVVIIFPYVFSSSRRIIDVLAVLCFVPAALAFVVAVWKRDTLGTTPLNLWGRFCFGWLGVLPAVVLCSVLGIFGMVLAVVLIFSILNVHGGGIALTIVVTAVIVGVEEFLKFLVAAKKDTITTVENPRQFVMYSLFSALGLATGEAFYLCLYLRRIFDAYMYAGARTPSGEHHSLGGGGGDFNRPGSSGSDYGWVSSTGATEESDHAAGHSWVHRMLAQAASIADVQPREVSVNEFLWILACCVVIFVPMHMLSGYHLGLGIARREVKKEHLSQPLVIVVPFLFRFFFFYIVLWLPALTQLEWSSFLAIILVPIYILVVRRDEMKMPRSYLTRAGYMNAFGYGVLPDSDEHDHEIPDPEHNATATVPVPTSTRPAPTSPVRGGAPASADVIELEDDVHNQPMHSA